MSWEERWEKREPVARVVYFGEPKIQEVAVYSISALGPGLLSLIIDRYKKPAPVVIHDSHLVALIDKTPRNSRPAACDLKVYMDGASTTIVSSTMRKQSGYNAVAAIMAEGDSRVRCLLGMSSIREIVHAREPEEVSGPIELPFAEDDELWPELRHNR